ncbi:MAG: TolC family protein [Chitinophagaceae bacterium]|nr:TolC family protein [Chitinophagaceae bacterium]
MNKHGSWKVPSRTGCHPLERKRIELAKQKLILKKVENESAKRLLSYKMNQLTGFPPEDFMQLKPQLLQALIDTAIRMEVRPEIKALNEGISALRYKEKAELTDYIPKVALFGQYETRKKDLSLFDPKWYAGVRLQWSVFDGLTAKNNAKKIALERKTLEVQKKSAADLFEKK